MASPTLSKNVLNDVSAVIPSNEPIDPSHILTLAEISARLKVSERWVYEKTRHRCRNPLPSIRIGRSLRFHWLDVSAWLRQQSTAPRVQAGEVRA
jgi:excisionase family DNA binding protein